MRVRRNLDPEQQWFAEARLGMFIHFGLYALLGRNEWVMYHEDIPREEYEKLARRFNPSRFNADEWVTAATECGCRYMAVTAKHHDGFCLFDSALTDFKITNTPFGRDLIGELIDACHRLNMRIVLYYSQPDWHHPAYVHRPGAFKDLQYERPDDTPDWPEYLRYYQGQVEELCTKYGRIDGIWFDGVQRTEQEWQGRRVYNMIRRLHPQAVVNDRAGYGDYFTPERNLANAAAAAGYMVEACQSIAADTWGYGDNAVLYSFPPLLHSLIRAASAGGNYLLNVGPRPDGTLPESWMERFRDLGRWLDDHGKALHGTVGCPAHVQGRDTLFTRSGDRLYLHLLKWPDTELVVLPAVKRAPLRARLLKANRRLEITNAAQVAAAGGHAARTLAGIARSVDITGDTVVLRGLPSCPPDPANTVVELIFDTENMLHRAPREPAPAAIAVAGDGPVRLPADHARRSGFGIKGAPFSLRPPHERDTPALQDATQAGVFSSAWQPEQKAEWSVECEREMPCRVAVELACPDQFAGSSFVVSAAGQRLEGNVPGTGSGHEFREVDLGVVTLPAGRSKVALSPRRLKLAYYFADVRAVIIRPAQA